MNVDIFYRDGDKDSMYMIESVVELDKKLVLKGKD